MSRSEHFAVGVGGEPAPQFHATRYGGRFADNGYGWVHVGTERSALDRVAHAQAKGAWQYDAEDEDQPSPDSHWTVHEVRLSGRVSPVRLTDQQATHVGENAAEPRHFGASNDYDAYPYTNEVEHPGSTSYVVRSHALRVVRSRRVEGA